jgi:hypothetical protein
MLAKSSDRRRKLLLSTIVVFLAVLTIGGLELTNVTHLFHDKPAITAGPATKGVAADMKNSTDQNSSIARGESSINRDKSASTSASSAELLAPSGIFVSNHHPNLSGSPAPNQINSNCNTTASAMCTIIFTKGNVTKSLPLQKADENGATYWTWKLQSVGLTEGVWQVQAKATLGDKQEATGDLRDLEVAQ